MRLSRAGISPFATRPATRWMGCNIDTSRLKLLLRQSIILAQLPWIGAYCKSGCHCAHKNPRPLEGGCPSLDLGVFGDEPLCRQPPLEPLCELTRQRAKIYRCRNLRRVDLRHADVRNWHVPQQVRKIAAQS